jgi:hypothetical protein
MADSGPSLDDALCDAICFFGILAARTTICVLFMIAPCQDLFPATPHRDGISSM